MDGQRFDRWTRSLVTASSRRSLVKGLAGAVVAVFAAGAGEIEAAPSCRGLRAGARCGTCGACDGNGTCVPNSDNCGDCKVCHPTSFRCTALPADTPCAACKTCQGGRCLEKRCGRGKRCCPSSSACVATGGCCTDAECGECGTCENGTCKSSPGKEGQDCGGSACKVCRGGQCVVKPENANCPGGKCCGGTCRANAACCTDEGCDDPDCGKCENFQCNRTAKNDRPCGNAPACHICKDGHCVNKPDNSNCRGSNGSCCGGACCIGNQICCEGQCCAGTCLPLVGCCGSSSFTAAGADLCCPFGPPCGEGNDARCCTEGQECCRGECKAPEDCCPEENVCGTRAARVKRSWRSAPETAAAPSSGAKSRVALAPPTMPSAAAATSSVAPSRKKRPAAPKRTPAASAIAANRG